MIQSREVRSQDRVLVLAPTALDAAMTQSILGEAGLRSEAHATVGTLLESMARNEAGALLITEMTVSNGGAEELGVALHSQHAWSDIPIVLLAGGGTDSPAAVMVLEKLGNVTVLERPTHVVTLVSTLRSSIRARRRQYELRDRLIALEKAEATVKSSERQFRRLVETAMEGIWQVDLDGMTTYVNQRLCDMLGESQAFVMSKPSLFFFHPDEVPLVAERIRNRLNSTGDTNEWRLRRSDGTYICVLSSAAPVRDASGTMVGAFAMMTDITDRKAGEEALRDSTRRKDEFIAVLAHELRNPLAPIRSSLQILRINEEEAEVTPAPVLDMLDRQVNHMVHLVDELLEISRISTGVIELHPVDVPLETVVATAVEASTPHIRAAGHELRVELPAQAVMLRVDPVRMAQVLTNVLNNAAKYSNRGATIVFSARVDATVPAPVVELTISDTGVGIDRTNLEKVFEMFSQIDRTVGRAHRGLGIGLALAKNLVHLHGGTIEARSEGVGAGSQFVIRLPHREYTHNTLYEVARATPTADARALDGRHVLVVDDNNDAADSIATLLRAAGASVDVAYSGEHALALWRLHHYGVVLLDVGMPVMDGCELARRIRKEAFGDEPSLIALTGWGQPDDRARTREAGINYHMVKPIEFETLRRLLMTLPSEGAER